MDTSESYIERHHSLEVQLFAHSYLTYCAANCTNKLNATKVQLPVMYYKKIECNITIIILF